MTATVARELAEHELFAGLTEDELAELAWACRRVSLADQERLFRQGAPGLGLVLVVRGRLEVSQRLLGGHRQALGWIEAGEIAGELALLGSQLRTATVRAHGPVEGWFLARERFEALRMAGRPGAGKLLRNLARVGALRLREMNRSLLEVDQTTLALGERAAPYDVDVTRRSLRAEDLDPDVLRALPLLSPLDDEELGELLAVATVEDLPRRALLFEAGDEADEAYVVLRGAVQVTVPDEGRFRKIALVGPGHPVGHLALIDAEPRAATCFARERTRVLGLTTEAFERLIWSDASVAFKLLDGVVQRLHESLRTANRRLAWSEASRLAQ